MLRLQNYHFTIQYKNRKKRFVVDTSSVSRGSQWWNRVPLRNNSGVRCISCGSHTDGPVTRPCQTRYNGSDHREDCGWHWTKWCLVAGPPKREKNRMKSEPTGSSEMRYDGVLFKCHQVIVPASLRPELLQKIHKAHQDEDSSIRRARISVYWPAMQAACSSCGVCSQYLRDGPQELMQSHTIPSRPWERVSADLFRLDGSNYLVLMDHYSDYIELEP